MRKPVERVCGRCSRSFADQNSQPRKFCSRECYGAAKDKRIATACPQCHSTFVEQERGQKYCSVTCRDDARRRYGICAFCGKVAPMFGDRKYCSWECFQRQVQSQRKRCEVCGEIVKIGRRKYCSYRCMGRAYRSRYAGVNNPNYRGRPAPNYGPDWDSIRHQVFARDQWKCAMCGIKGYFECHHIDSIRLFLDHRFANLEQNLITLCKRCHNHAHCGKLSKRRLQGYIKSFASKV